MADGSSSFLVINDVIMTSPLLFYKDLYMLANFLILSDTILFSILSFMSTSRKI